MIRHANQRNGAGRLANVFTLGFARRVTPYKRADDREVDAQLLYNKLETVILPLYYRDQDRFIDVMRHAIALNGSYFNTERMVDQYVRKAYFC